jgi:hypothetical protein
MGLIEFGIALGRAVADGFKAYRTTLLRPDLQSEGDYAREIHAIWLDYELFRKRREQERDEVLERERARLVASGLDPDGDEAQRALERIRRDAKEDIRQRGREAQRKAYPLEREMNRRFRSGRSWRDV